MARTRRGARITRRGARIALLPLMLLAFAAPGAAFAVAGDFKLVLAPIGQAGPYFDLVMEPGDTAHLEVALGNDGSAGVAARTYATDVFTITNGGYGGRLRDEAQTGTTAWLTYPTAVVDLPAGAHTRRALTVTVPLDAGPGEYISSLVIENDVPVPGGGAIAFDQFVRQAIAVVVTVPGARTPELHLGAAHHEVVAGRSVVTIAAVNSGNVRLKPAVAFVLRDASRTEISRTTFQMDTFYARTDALVSVSLAALLPSGTYTIELTLADTAQTVEATGVIDLVVGAAPTNAQRGVDGPGLTPVGPGGAFDPMLLGVVALAIALALLGLGALAIERKRRRTQP
jgi:hypothetical protein